MDLMIDIETLGTHPKSPIISIGAVFFDIEGGEIINEFYIDLDIKDQIDTGIRTVDADTLKWWMNQSDAAKKIFKDEAYVLPTQGGLEHFVQWVKDHRQQGSGVWGNGATFDIVLLESIFKDYNIKNPWNFWEIMDMRTFRRFVGKMEPIEKRGINHNALDDAVAQALYCIKHYKGK